MPHNAQSVGHSVTQSVGQEELPLSAPDEVSNMSRHPLLWVSRRNADGRFVLLVRKSD